MGDLTQYVNAVSTVGFPIFCCCCMGYYVKYMTDKNREQIDDMQQKHREEVQQMTEALNNNTLAIQKLCDKF